MLRRFMVYLVGVGLGVVLVFLFFGNRVDVLKAWLPSPRVKAEIVDKLDKEAARPCLESNSFALLLKFIDEADVAFDELVKTDSSRIYTLRYEDLEKRFEIGEKRAVLICDE